MTQYAKKGNKIGRKILDMIISMYKSRKVSLIHQDKKSKTFLIKIGLKQGGVLNKILFNFCINDLPGQ